MLAELAYATQGGDLLDPADYGTDEIFFTLPPGRCSNAVTTSCDPASDARCEGGFNAGMSCDPAAGNADCEVVCSGGLCVGGPDAGQPCPNGVSDCTPDNGACTFAAHCGAAGADCPPAAASCSISGVAVSQGVGVLVTPHTTAFAAPPEQRLVGAPIELQEFKGVVSLSTLTEQDRALLAVDLLQRNMVAPVCPRGRE